MTLLPCSNPRLCTPGDVSLSQALRARTCVISLSNLFHPPFICLLPLQFHKRRSAYLPTHKISRLEDSLTLINAPCAPTYLYCAARPYAPAKRFATRQRPLLLVLCVFVDFLQITRSFTSIRPRLAEIRLHDLTRDLRLDSGYARGIIVGGCGPAVVHFI